MRHFTQIVIEFVKSNLQLMFLRVHMEIALFLLLMFLLSWLDSDVDASSWSGREQRGLFINTNVSSSEHVTQHRKTRKRLHMSHTAGLHVT